MIEDEIFIDNNVSVVRNDFTSQYVTCDKIKTHNYSIKTLDKELLDMTEIIMNLSIESKELKEKISDAIAKLFFRCADSEYKLIETKKKLEEVYYRRGVSY